MANEKENKTVHNKKQDKVARELAELGYDGIIGSHPHVLQPFTYLDVKDKRVEDFLVEDKKKRR